MTSTLAAIALAVFACSAIMTFALRWFARRRHLFDHPGERSSHQVPTPRLGGVAIAVAALVGWLLAPIESGTVAAAVAAIAAGAAVMAVVGLIDDLWGLSPVVKLAGQLIAVAVVLNAWRVAAGDARSLLVLSAIGLAIVSYVNFFNFMDGTDGLAAGVAIVAAVALSALSTLSGSAMAPWLFAIAAASTAGFLIFNRPPATIFMGDTGSLFLGYSLATIAIAPGVARLGVAVPLLVLSPFLFDAAYTLLDRARRGQAVWRPHRDHLYQRLVRDGVSHAHIMMTYCAWTAFGGALGLLWLILPAARVLVLIAAALPPMALVYYVQRREQRARLPVPPG